MVNQTVKELLQQKYTGVKDVVSLMGDVDTIVLKHEISLDELQDFVALMTWRDKQ